jgi:hypothetical protein
MIPKNFRRNQIRLRTSSHLVSISPYRPRTIQSKNLSPKKHQSIMSNFFVAPIISNNFPKRRLNSPGKFLKTYIVRSKSCLAEKTPIFDVETIERMQKLLPCKHFITTNLKSSHLTRHSPVSSPQTNSLMKLGFIKELDLKHTFYKKYMKHSI